MRLQPATRAEIRLQRSLQSKSALMLKRTDRSDRVVRYRGAQAALFSSAKNSDSPQQDDTDTDSNEPSKSRNKHVVRWETASGIVEFSAYDGEILRTAALRRGIVSPHNGRAQLINCRGLGTCGTCAVEIKSGIIPPERNAKEKLRLSFPPHGSADQSPSLRLSCQLQVVSDMEVTKRAGFWGQDPQELSKSDGCATYFGNLEFILDDKSPSDDGNKGIHIPEER